MEKSCSQIFAEKLRDLMKENDLSIAQLALNTGIPRTSINNWLNQQRNPKMDYLRSLSRYFNCTIDYLLGCEDDFGNKTD